jgi:hypothetical protein
MRVRFGVACASTAVHVYVGLYLSVLSDASVPAAIVVSLSECLSCIACSYITMKPLRRHYTV